MKSSPAPFSALGPPLWEMTDAEQGEFDPPAQPAPDDPFDQRIAWQRLHEDDPIRSGSSGTACTIMAILVLVLRF